MTPFQDGVVSNPYVEIEVHSIDGQGCIYSREASERTSGQSVKRKPFECIAVCSCLMTACCAVPITICRLPFLNRSETCAEIRFSCCIGRITSQMGTGGMLRQTHFFFLDDSLSHRCPPCVLAEQSCDCVVVSPEDAMISIHVYDKARNNEMLGYEALPMQVKSVMLCMWCEV